MWGRAIAAWSGIQRPDECSLCGKQCPLESRWKGGVETQDHFGHEVLIGNTLNIARHDWNCRTAVWLGHLCHLVLHSYCSGIRAETCGLPILRCSVHPGPPECRPEFVQRNRDVDDGIRGDDRIRCHTIKITTVTIVQRIEVGECKRHTIRICVTQSGLTGTTDVVASDCASDVVSRRCRRESRNTRPGFVRNDDSFSASVGNRQSLDIRPFGHPGGAVRPSTCDRTARAVQVGLTRHAVLDTNCLRSATHYRSGCDDCSDNKDTARAILHGSPRCMASPVNDDETIRPV